MQITNKPFQLVFAGNPMRYLLTPGSGGGGGGIEDVFSVIEIEFTDIDSTVDHSMEVTMFDESRSFTLKSEPSGTDHLPVADDQWDAARWALAVFQYIINDKELIENYAIEIEGGKITLTARTADPLYDMTIGSSNINGVTITTVTEGQQGTPGEVEGVRMTVWKNGTEKIAQEYKPVDAEGNVRFEIQEYIYAHLLLSPAPRFHLTKNGSAFQYLYSDYILKYLTSFCNKVDGEFEPRAYSDPDYPFCYAIGGGLNREDLVANNSLGTNWFNLAATKKKFLTWAPPSRITDKEETHSLFFAFQETAFQAFRYKANLFSATQNTSVYLSGNLNASQWKVYEFLGGYNQLLLDTYLDGGVIRWELYLVDLSDNIVSDIREFILDDEYHENVRYFRFRNSWGTYDSFRCTGVVETILEHDREKVAYMSEDVETSFNAPGSHTFIKETQSYKANSGWLYRDYLSFLRDFMLSADIYELEDGRLLKCLLTSKKTSLFKDKQYNYALQFEYERGYENFFFQGLE